MTDTIPNPATRTTSPVGLRVDAGVATVTLQRPDAMNALDIATKEALLATLRGVADDERVRAVVLTGSGRAFCVGQDLREHARLMQQDDSVLLETVRRHYNPVVELLATMPKPVVAAVNGIAAGAGAAFAFAADLRVVAKGGGFTLAFAGVGLSCDSGSSWSLPRLVGMAKAKELLLLPRTVEAEEALELGLVTEVVPAERLQARVAELAAQLAAGPTLAYASMRAALAYSAGHDLPTSLAHEAELMARTGASEDHRGAVTAFLDKRQPVFEGR